MQRRQCTVLFVLAIAAGSVSAFAQKVELGAYGGGSFFSQPSFTSPAFTDPFTQRIEYKFVDGGLWGFRARENITDHISLEQSYTVAGTQNAIFSDGTVVGTRTHQFYFNGNYNLRSIEARIRPYLTGGFGWSTFSPTDDGKAAANDYVVSRFGSNIIDSDTVLPINAGVGVRWRLARHFGLDFSARDFIHKSPTYNFPNPTDRDWDNNIQVQGGLSWMFGGYRPIIVHNFTVDPAIQASNNVTSLCPGEATVLRIGAASSIPDNQVTYQWTLRGQNVSMDPEFRFVAPDTAGPYDVGVRVFYKEGPTLDKAARNAIKKNPGAPVDRRITMNVKEYRPPTVTTTVEKTIIQRVERVHLTGSATGSECSGMLTYRWTSSVSRIVAAPDGTSADFDGSGVEFSDAVQGQQCKAVALTLEVSDQRGGTAKSSKDVQVCYTAPPPVVAAPPPPPKPSATQVSDINFAMNSSRVNNCAKRVLANELYPQLVDARYRDYDILLVGHRDPGEAETVGRGQAASTLDRDRALNAAAFLSGKGTSCKDIELTRIKVGWAGTEQKSDFRSNFCDASTLERSRDTVSESDEKSKNRRVSIWLVPKDAALPPDITSVQDVTSDITKRACPR
jgi:outer membrane protein OmpA-like peptidoglycan-associated protein